MHGQWSSRCLPANANWDDKRSVAQRLYCSVLRSFLGLCDAAERLPRLPVVIH